MKKLMPGFRVMHIVDATSSLVECADTRIFPLTQRFLVRQSRWSAKATRLEAASTTAVGEANPSP
jgi:hypothetical protein